MSSTTVRLSLRGIAAIDPRGRELFSSLDLDLGQEYLGLVGRNGSGKSTLLRIISGDASPAAGRIVRPADCLLLDQTAGTPTDLTVADLIGQRAALDLIDRALAGRIDARDAARIDWSLEARIAAALTRMGLADLDVIRPAATLSGGERARLRLAGAILAEPDLLLLDEPTNHLDESGRQAVASLIADWTGGLIIASHDRDLLRGLPRILELAPGRVFHHTGGGEAWLAARTAREAAAHAAMAAARDQMSRTKREASAAAARQDRRDAAGRRHRARGDMPKILLDARQDRAERSRGRGNRLAARHLETAAGDLTAARAALDLTGRPAFSLPATGLARGRELLDMRDVVTAAGISLPDLSVTGPERIAITGPNGAGKTSLLRIAAGLDLPRSGSVRRPGRIALLDQHADLLDPALSLLDNLRRHAPDAGEEALRAILARFLFRGDAALRQTAMLSGGERVRVALACLLGQAEPPELLLLDEPTNHLDLEATETVETALAAWDGALVLVSHDLDLLARVGIGRHLRLPA
ncbi:ABC-F family ATP-binding cassette domain-containing protein [Tistrella mobilis]|uniref:ABC-F family ATP-binding cassette domain-containing protein n=1 Tax=Tistrella mobilis TaxID=171437 RepID=UPI0035576D07